MRIATTLLLALVSGSLMVFAAPDVGEVTTNTLMIAGSAGRKLAGGYGVCQCQTAWWYNGNQYSGSTYDYSPNGQPWCMVNEYCDSNTCDGTHGQQNWKYCPKCECKPSWSYKGCTYTGCSTVDSPNKPWCVVNDDCLTFDGLTYGQKWKYCPSTSVPAASPPPPSPCPVASPPPPSPCPVASPPPPSPCPVASPPPPAVSVTPCASPPPPAVSTTPCPSPAPKCYCLPSYVYKGCTYTGCTTAGSYPNKPWCVVNADCPHWDGIEAQTSPSGQKWMYCPYTPPVTQPKPPAKPVKCGCLPSYVYKGCTYSGCTTVDSYNKPWCVINADCPHWDGIEAHTSPSGQKWMYCPSTPPVTKPKPPPVTCRCEPVFWYKGCKYTGPTTVDSKRAWCVVNDDCPNGSYNGKEGQTTPPNKKWMYV